MTEVNYLPAKLGQEFADIINYFPNKSDAFYAYVLYLYTLIAYPDTLAEIDVAEFDDLE